jgi:sec-independent protein translocase protein TatC
MLPIILWFFINFIQQYPQPASTTPDAPNTATADPPPGKITILERDPANPADGDAWIKMPEGELRIHFNAQTLSVALSAGAASMVTFNPRLSDYISFVTMVAIGIVVAFQKPVVMFVLGWTGLVDPRWLSKYRRHCIVACFAMGMLLTPSDVVSMVVLAMPLWGLFELGLLLMRIVYRPPDVAGES